MTVALRVTVMLGFLAAAVVSWHSIGLLPESVQSVVHRLFETARGQIGWEVESGQPGQGIQYEKTAPRFKPLHAIQNATPQVMQIRRMLNELRNMGASDYRLEHWGSDGLVRFNCTMPLTIHQDQGHQDQGHQDQLCHFDAIGSDASEAVKKVFQEITSDR